MKEYRLPPPPKQLKAYTGSRISAVGQLQIPHRGFKGLEPIYLSTVSQPNVGGTGPNFQNWQTYNGKRVDTHGFMATIYPSIAAAREQGYKKVLIWGISGCQEEVYDTWGAVTSNTQMRRYWTAQMADFETFISAVTEKLGMPVGCYRGYDNTPLMYVNGSYELWNTGSANPNYSGNEWEDEDNRDLLVQGMVELSDYFSFFGGDAVYYPALYRTTAFLDFLTKITKRGLLYFIEGSIPDVSEGITEANKLRLHSFCPEIGVANTGNAAPSDIISGNYEVAKMTNPDRQLLLGTKMPGYRQLFMFNGSGQNDNAQRRAQTLQLLQHCRANNIIPVANMDLSIYRGQW